MSALEALSGITVLKALATPDSDRRCFEDGRGQKQADNAQLDYEEVAFKDISDEAVLSMFVCPEKLCGKVLKSKITLKRHVKAKHAQIRAMDYEKNCPDDLSIRKAAPTCDYCGKHFTRKSNMKQHMMKCNKRALAKVEDDNSGGREEPSGENNLGVWDGLGILSRQVEIDIFAAMFEREVGGDSPKKGNDDPVAEGGAEDVNTVEQLGEDQVGDAEDISTLKKARGVGGAEDEITQEEREDEVGGAEDNAAGIQEEHAGDAENGGDSEKSGDEAGREEEESVSLENENYIRAKDKEEKKKEVSLQEAGLLSLLAAGLATSGNILSSLTTHMQVLLLSSISKIVCNFRFFSN